MSQKIRIRDLRKSFGSKTVLDGVSLDLEAHQSLVIIGGSGSGKSVLLKCILGLLRPDSGQIEIDGEDVIAASPARRSLLNQRMGMLFQNGALFDSLTVWENVAFGLMEGRGMPRHDARVVAIKKLAQVGLEEQVGELRPSEISGGMQKRVGLARAIATDPEVIFFDEPTTGLDPIMGDIINDLIVRCVKEAKASALTITHDMASARKIGDRIAMLYQGKIIWSGAAAEIEQSHSPHVDQFIHGRAEGPIKMAVRA